MALAALNALGGLRAGDEELVAIVENDACGVDALQCLTGCTFGKGNLIFKNYGKQVYTLYRRSSKKGVRVAFAARTVPQGVRQDRAHFIAWLLEAPQQEIMTLQNIEMAEPEPARATASVACALCQEAVMKTRTKKMQGKTVCIPCAQKQHKSVRRKR